MANENESQAQTEEVKIPTKDELLESVHEEATEESAETPSSSLSEAEQRAFEKGWRPKDQFHGDPDDWRPAKEWLERGEIFERMRHISKEAHDARNALTSVYQEFMKYREVAYKQALEDLKSQRKQAWNEGDYDAVEKLEEKIDQTKEQQAIERAKARAQVQQQQAQNQNQLDPDVQAWIDRNKWYTEDREMRAYADATANIYVDEQKRLGKQVDPHALQTHVESSVRKIFSDKFRKGPPSPDSQGSRQQSGSNRTTDKYAQVERNMSEEELKIMNTLVKHSGISKEQYMKDYIKASEG